MVVQNAVSRENVGMNSLYRALDVTVQGWLRATGKLWGVGKTVTIDSDMLNLRGQMVTNTISFRQGQEVTTTVLGLKLANSVADDILTGALKPPNLGVTKSYTNPVPAWHGPH